MWKEAKSTDVDNQQSTEWSLSLYSIVSICTSIYVGGPKDSQVSKWGTTDLNGGPVGF